MGLDHWTGPRYVEREVSQSDVDRALFLPTDDPDARAFALSKSGAVPYPALSASRQRA